MISFEPLASSHGRGKLRRGTHGHCNDFRRGLYIWRCFLHKILSKGAKQRVESFVHGLQGKKKKEVVVCKRMDRSGSKRCV